VPEVDTGREMTERLARWVGRQALEYTYADIAKQIGVNEKTVRNIFDEYVASLEMQFKRETPVWLGIDEIKLKRFRAIFTNLQPRLSIRTRDDGEVGCETVSLLARSSWLFHGRRTSGKNGRKPAASARVGAKRRLMDNLGSSQVAD
jgi:hypothetical protein